MIGKPNEAASRIEILEEPLIGAAANFTEVTSALKVLTAVTEAAAVVGSRAFGASVFPGRGVGGAQ